MDQMTPRTDTPWYPVTNQVFRISKSVFGAKLPSKDSLGNSKSSKVRGTCYPTEGTCNVTERWALLKPIGQKDRCAAEHPIAHRAGMSQSTTSTVPGLWESIQCLVLL